MGSAAATLTRPRGERNEDDDDDERNHESRRDGDATATRSMPAARSQRRETTRNDASHRKEDGPATSA
jgi:hypothetical protein